MLFKKDNEGITVTEVSLKKDYTFMYENFIVSSQQKLFLLLKTNDDKIDALEFHFFIYKFGYPNDEVSHPLSKYGLGFYGLFQVNNSPWVKELKENNQVHPRHSDDLFNKYKHYIAKFKDVTIEVLCTKMEEKELTKAQLFSFLEEQINFLQE